MKSKALLLLVIATQLTCHQVIFHAPPGAEMSCIANPTAIQAFNGVSVISCLLVEEIGTPVADGTVVQFFTDLGRVPEQGRTNDGVVRINLQSDGRSGTANVSAFSGGGTNTPPSSATTSTVTTTPAERSGVRTSALASSSSVSALRAQDSVTVDIGNLNADDIIITAFPLRLTDSRTSQLTANVFDGNGNPAPGVPVFFDVTEFRNDPPPTGTPTPTPNGGGQGPTPTPTVAPTGTPTPRGGTGAGLEHLDSQGRPVYTDSNGQARDVLRTRYPREAPQRTVEVRARVPGGSVEDRTNVIIN